METLKQIVMKYNLFLFADEAYREFCYDGNHTSAMHLQGAEQHVVLMDTISKRYSACGGRIGAFITKNKEVLDAAMKFAQARLSPPFYAQVLGEAAVDLPDNYFDTTKAEYKLRRDTIVKRLNNIPGVFCPNPGGAVFWTGFKRRVRPGCANSRPPFRCRKPLSGRIWSGWSLKARSPANTVAPF